MDYTQLPHADLELTNGDLILIDRQGRYLKRWNAKDGAMSDGVANPGDAILNRRWFAMPSVAINQAALTECQRILDQWPEGMTYSMIKDERCYQMQEQSLVDGNKRAFRYAGEVQAKRQRILKPVLRRAVGKCHKLDTPATNNHAKASPMPVIDAE